jgi:type III pantothenate kinase
MLLAIDISNTTIKAGVFQGDKLVDDWRFATERHRLTDEYAMLLLSLFEARGTVVKDISGVSISCVVPPLRSVFRQLAQQYLNVDPIIVSQQIKTGVKLGVDNPSEVGGDRIVNAYATHKLYGGPAIAIAFGTATVFDCVSAAGEYLGGAIAPGMVGALESLTRNAAQLYQVELVSPPKPIGTNTVETLQSGLVLGYAGLVEGLVKRLKKAMLDSNPSDTFKVIATGGLADVVTPETDVIDTVDQQLTLKGLQLIYELNKPKR